MTDDSNYNEHGDPDTDPHATAVDDALRDLLTFVPDELDAVLPADALAQIRDAVEVGWPDGHPPTVDELANDGAHGAPVEHSAADLSDGSSDWDHLSGPDHISGPLDHHTDPGDNHHHGDSWI